MNKRHLPSITALQCFEAVTRHLSFTRAAEELSLTQSAVSKQVAQLEEMLQQLLFRRVRRRLQLTPAGALYLAEVRKILEQIELSTHYLRSYGGETEVLRISTPSTFGARWLVPRLKGWRLRHPHIHLDICNEPSGDEHGIARADLAFYFGPRARPGAECMRLFQEELVAVCAPNTVPGETLADAIRRNELVLLHTASRPQAWPEWFASQGLQTEHSYHGPRFDTFYMSIRAAQVGCGIALLPRFLIEEELAENKLVLAWPDLPSVIANHATRRNAYYLACPEHTVDVPKVRSFVQWIGEQLTPFD